MRNGQLSARHNLALVHVIADQLVTTLHEESGGIRSRRILTEDQRVASCGLGITQDATAVSTECPLYKLPQLVCRQCQVLVRSMGIHGVDSVRIGTKNRQEDKKDKEVTTFIQR